jgi:hypothetical protein
MKNRNAKIKEIEDDDLESSEKKNESQNSQMNNSFADEMELIQNSVLYNNADDQDGNTPYVLNSLNNKKR